jgi:hypothetical protein
MSHSWTILKNEKFTEEINVIENSVKITPDDVYMYCNECKTETRLKCETFT